MQCLCAWCGARMFFSGEVGGADGEGCVLKMCFLSDVRHAIC